MIRLTRYVQRVKLANVIKSFKNKETARLAANQYVGAFDSIQNVARRKPDLLKAATSLSDVSVIPGNRFEALSGDRAGQYSIRINDQYRICFTYSEQGFFDVEITDYH